ncbi:hypothetical protein ACFVGN_38365, partial [Streptomyces sp. NPDC057757]
RYSTQEYPADAETRYKAQETPADAVTQHTTQESPAEAETRYSTQAAPVRAETQHTTQASPAQAETPDPRQASPVQAAPQDPRQASQARTEQQPAATDASQQLTATHSAAEPVATQPAAQEAAPQSAPQPAPQPAPHQAATHFSSPPPPTYPASPDATATGTNPGTPTPPAAPSRRTKRTTVLVAAGAALCVLALAGTGYALLDNSDGDGKSGNAAGDGSGASATKDPSQNADEAAAPDTANGGQDTSASEGVQMQVTGSRTTYSGQCPPPDGEAPTFTATFTVERLPAQFSYRWVSTDGSVTDEQWRTLSFPNGGSLTTQVSVSLTTWAKSGTLESAIGVELNAPLQGRSNMVPLSLTCA